MQMTWSQDHDRDLRLDYISCGCRSQRPNVHAGLSRVKGAERPDGTPRPTARGLFSTFNRLVPRTGWAGSLGSDRSRVRPESRDCIEQLGRSIAD